MPENKIVKTIKLMYREDFEEKTSELITVGGYSILSAGFSLIPGDKDKRGYWWAVLVKEDKKE
jgi:hypothetical protein